MQLMVQILLPCRIMKYCVYNEVQILISGILICPECGEKILPCSMCDMDNVNCNYCRWEN